MKRYYVSAEKAQEILGFGEDIEKYDFIEFCVDEEKDICESVWGVRGTTADDFGYDNLNDIEFQTEFNIFLSELEEIAERKI